MLTVNLDAKIYLCTGKTDMRKGCGGLAALANTILEKGGISSGALFVFRGTNADKIKILYWDGQGFCLFYKCLDRGKFIWPSSDDKRPIGVTRAQLSMLLEAIDWRNPQWTSPPEYTG